MFRRFFEQETLGDFAVFDQENVRSWSKKLDLNNSISAQLDVHISVTIRDADLRRVESVDSLKQRGRIPASSAVAFRPKQ